MPLTMLQRDFIWGEEKYIDFQITSRVMQAVVVTAADFTLFKDFQIVQQGKCEIDGAYLSALIKPPDVGEYLLEVRYTVPPETRKVKVVIHVR